MSVNENVTENIEDTDRFDTERFEYCEDCNSYDDISQPDTFLMPFGDGDYICTLCAEERERNNGKARNFQYHQSGQDSDPHPPECTAGEAPRNRTQHHGTEPGAEHQQAGRHQVIIKEVDGTRRHVITAERDEWTERPDGLAPCAVMFGGYDSADDWRKNRHEFELEPVITRMLGEDGDGLNPGLKFGSRSRFDRLNHLVRSVNRYAALTGSKKRLFIYLHTGYSQSDWAYVIVEAKHIDIAGSSFDIWSRWAKGDVYMARVMLEKFDTEFDEWYPISDVDILGDIYADDEDEEDEEDEG